MIIFNPYWGFVGDEEMWACGFDPRGRGSGEVHSKGFGKERFKEARNSDMRCPLHMDGSLNKDPPCVGSE